MIFSFDHLDDGIVPVNATTRIYDGWDGRFNLSHGPCDPGNGVATYSIDPVCWKKGRKTASFIVNHVTLTVQGQGGPYIIDSDVSLKLQPGDYEYTAEADDGYILEGDAEGEFTITKCPVNGGFKEGFGGVNFLQESFFIAIAAILILFAFRVWVYLGN